MATLTSMERGTLSEEYRTRRSIDGGESVTLGPYFKHQAWEGGRNVSRRVPEAEVNALRNDLANYERFTELCAAFVNQSVALARQRRALVVEL